MKITKNIILFFIIFCNTQLVFANGGDQGVAGIFDELSYQEIVEVNLEMNMHEVFGDRKNTKKHPAIFSFSDKKQVTQNWNIKVALRGRFRRAKCENLPPLKLNFKKKDLVAAGLAKFDDMKLVTHCVEDDKEAKQLLIREYVAYKIYNQITDNSFRVQFVKINYKDSETNEIDTQYGFLIEDTAQLRARIQADKIKEEFNLPIERFHLTELKKVSLFNYMIGNTDWSTNRLHNVKIVMKDGKRLVIPYDFDFSGIVGAPYVLVDPELGITSTKDRVYLGFESELEMLEETKILFKNRKVDIIRTIKECKLLNGKNRRELVRFINSFYRDIDNIKLPKNKVKPPTLG